MILYFERDETVQWNTQIHSQEYTQRLLTTFKVGFFKKNLKINKTHKTGVKEDDI